MFKAYKGVVEKGRDVKLKHVQSPKKQLDAVRQKELFAYRVHSTDISC